MRTVAAYDFSVGDGSAPVDGGERESGEARTTETAGYGARGVVARSEAPRIPDTARTPETTGPADDAGARTDEQADRVARIDRPARERMRPSPLAPFDRIRVMLKDAVDHGVFPGASVVVARGSGRDASVLLRAAEGDTSFPSADAPEPFPVSSDTVYDVAGMTSGVVTTTIFLRLVALGRLRLEERVSRYLPGFGILGKSPVTIGHLLSHTSGAPNWHPFFEELLRERLTTPSGTVASVGAKDFVLNSILRSPQRGEIGARYVYSDVGLMVLGAVAELAAGTSFEKAALEHVFRPMKLRATSFIDIPRMRRSGLKAVTELVAPTEQCEWRRKLLWGEVHDDNAWALGGVAPHSGLFSCAGDLSRFGGEMLAALKGRSACLDRDVVRTFLAGTLLPGGRRVRFGWDSPTRENGLEDVGFGEDAFGYNGFTGCSLWIDPASDLTIVLLSNRVHPSRSNKRILAFRPDFFRAVIEAARRC